MARSKRKSFEEKLAEFEQLRQQAHQITQRHINEMSRDKLRRYVRRMVKQTNSNSGTQPQPKGEGIENGNQ